MAIVEDVKIEITELPIGTWTQAYKENVLEPLIHGNEKTKAVITVSRLNNPMNIHIPHSYFPL